MKRFRVLLAVSLIMLMVSSSLTVGSIALMNDSLDHYGEVSSVSSSSSIDFHLVGLDYNVSFYSTRTVFIGPYGTISINDTIKMENKDIREFNAFLVFYKLSDLAKFYNLRIIGVSKEGFREKLRWVPYVQLGDYVGLAIILGQYVKKGSFYRVFIYANIRGVPNFTVDANNLVMYIEFSQKILLPYRVKDHITYFKLGDKNAHLLTDKITPSNGTKESETTYKYAFSNAVLFNINNPGEETVVKLYWRTTTPILYVSQLERELTFSVTGTLHVKDIFYFVAIAPKDNKPPAYLPWRITDVTIGLPKGVSNPIVSDDLGKLNAIKSTSDLFPEDYDAYKISFRTPLAFGGPYKVTVEYDLDSENRWFNANDTHWNITMPILPLINTTVLSAKLSISYPSEYKIVKVSGIGLKNYSEFASVGVFGLLIYNTRTYSLTNVDPDENVMVNIVIETNYLPLLDLAIRLFVIVLAIISVLNLAIGVYLKRREEAVEMTIEEKREMEKKLNRYIMYYEEYVAAETALDEFIKSKLTVRKSPKTIRDNLTRLIDTNKKYRDRVKLYGDQLKADKDAYKIVRELNDLEDKINFTRRELILDWSKFLGGKIGKKELVARAESLFGDINRYKHSRNRLLNRLRNILVTRYKSRK